LKKHIYLAATIAAMALLMSGCGRVGGTIAAVLLFLIGGVALLLAVVRTIDRIRYIRKRKAQGRRTKSGLSPATLLLYVIALCVLISGVLVSCCTDRAPTPEQPEETAVTTTTTAAPTWLRDPTHKIKAEQYFVYDVTGARFTTLSGDETERIYPASVTKLFTAYIALQVLDPLETITAGDELDLVVYGSSVADIQKGDIMSVEMLVEAMLLPSGNDAAYMLATAAGRRMGSDSDSVSTAVDRFVARMNEKAKEYGMTDTHFANPDGIHSDDHYTTPHDLAILGTLALGNETIGRYASTDSALVTPISGEQKTWENTNELINPASPYYCSACVGLKTGQTPYAGSCLLSAFRYGDNTFLVGVFGCPEEEDRFPDSLYLFNTAAGL